MDREKQDPIEVALDADSSLSRRLAERYLGGRRNRASDPVPDQGLSLEASIEEVSPPLEP